MTHSAGRVPVALLLAAACLSGCSTGASPRAAATTPAPATVTPGPTAEVRAVVDDVELVVAGVHLHAGDAADAGAAGAAAAAGVPVGRIALLHLELLLRNTGTQPRQVAADALALSVGRGPDQVAGPGTFPPDPLPPGSETQTAAAFDVVVGGGGGSPVLRWTHLGRTRLLPVGQLAPAG